MWVSARLRRLDELVLNRGRPITRGPRPTRAEAWHDLWPALLVAVPEFAVLAGLLVAFPHTVWIVLVGIPVLSASIQLISLRRRAERRRESPT